MIWRHGRSEEVLVLNTFERSDRCNQSCDVMAANKKHADTHWTEGKHDQGEASVSPMPSGCHSLESVPNRGKDNIVYRQIVMGKGKFEGIGWSKADPHFGTELRVFNMKNATENLSPSFTFR